ncbi:MAG: glutamate racemase [Acidovorax sp.]|jgi:glutamate racemase
MPLASSPIGVFDSGVGGLSVLQALLKAMPHERFVYLADSAHAPYGERGDAYVSARSHAIVDYLCEQHNIKALVVACNTATAAAIHEVRSSRPQLPLVGLEPAIKPALAATRTGHIGVIGTRGTLSSAKFSRLLASVADQARFHVQPCDGLAHAIERSAASACGPADAAIEISETGALCSRYLSALGPFGSDPGQVDTLVLGCTHYIFAAKELRAITGPEVRLIETGEPVARQTQRLLEAAMLLNHPDQAANDETGAERGLPPDAPATAQVTLLTTGPVETLQSAAKRWLDLPAHCCESVQVP